MKKKRDYPGHPTGNHQPGKPFPAARFTGATLAEAVTGVRLAYGPGAIILSNRTCRKYGLFGPAMVEVIARPGDPPSEGGGPGAARTIGARPGAARSGSIRPGSARPDGVRTPDGRPEPENPGQVPMKPAVPLQVQTGQGAAPGLRDTLEELLKTAGAAPWLATMLSTNALSGGRPPLLSTRQLATALGGALGELMGQPRPVETGAGAGRVVAFVGPPGGGKTTALVKVACELALAGGQHVSLVSVDTHRLAAAEQLARYAGILGLDFAVAYTPGELRRHCENLSRSGIVLVDTPGHVWRSSDDLAELASFLEAASPAEVHLVLPAARDHALAQHAMNAYRPLGVDRLLITGVDEVESYGPVINLAAATRLPVSYLGYGPEVPGRLEIPDPRDIAPALLGGQSPRARPGVPDVDKVKGAGAVG